MNIENRLSSVAALKSEFREQLLSIADWWATNTIDHDNGGFYGEVDVRNVAARSANKGIILNSRILWFFSEVAQETIDTKNHQTYIECATRAYHYIVAHFIDTDYGGVYWELDSQGQPISTKKQVYAHAFSIYALCAYFKLTQDQQALSHALNCFDLLEAKAVDRHQLGYLEAFARDWSAIDDWRLSDVDLNYPKSQNTHLHVLEAYTSLYSVHPTLQIKAALRYNIELFDKYMINRDNHHLRMFMDMQWKDYSPGFTYGHDIEASWLLAKALEALGDSEYAQRLSPTLIKIAEVTLNEAVGEQGQVLNSYDYASQQQSIEAVWWVQAEALVGFLFAFVSSRDDKYFSAAENLWGFIKQHQIDHDRGEWFWLADDALSNGEQHYKVGFWKCPYHNGRAMMDATRYLQQIELTAKL